MTILNMGLDDFKKAVEQFIQDLVKKGLMPANSDVKKLANTIAEALHQDPQIKLSGPDIKNNKEVQKSLTVACLAIANPKNTFDFRFLFKGLMSEDDLKKQLKNIFSDMLKLKLDKGKRKLTEEEKKILDKQLDVMAALLAKVNITKQHGAKEILGSCLYQNVKDLASEYNFVLHGVDLANPGSHQKTVFAIPTGNETARPNISDATGSTASYMDDQVNVDPTAYDYVGAKINIIINQLLDGVMTSGELALSNMGIIPKGPEAENKNSYTSPTPFHITPKPPGIET